MVFITIKGKEKLSVCSVIHSQSGPWCPPPVSCPWPCLPDHLISGTSIFKQRCQWRQNRDICAELLAQENPANTERNVKVSSGKSQNFEAAAQPQRGSCPMNPSLKRSCWDPRRSLRKILRTECRWRRSDQDGTANNKSQHYQPESMPRNSGSGGKGMCVLLGVGENWLPPMPGG